MNPPSKIKASKVNVAPKQLREDRQLEGSDCRVSMNPPSLDFSEGNFDGGMPKVLVQGFLNSTGHDLSHVKVRYNSEKPKQVQALAYAQGDEIHLGPGQEGHLPHEAGHIVQQMEGKVEATKHVAGQPVNADPALETAASQLGAAALAAAKAPRQPAANAIAKRNVARVIQREPIRRQAGTAQQFIEVFNNTPSGMGRTTGDAAHRAMLRLGETSFDWSQMRPLPTTTPYFNNRPARYVYTTRGGWIDMVHFLFYAGKAYKYKVDRDNAIRQRQEAETRMRDASRNGGGYGRSYYPTSPLERMDPIGEAVQDGYRQELSDRLAAPHSAYSYEDLPSDTFGARFAVQHFDAHSGRTFGEQVLNYLVTVLGATTPDQAPNFESLPENEPTDRPTHTNRTTTPMFTRP